MQVVALVVLVGDDHRHLVGELEALEQVGALLGVAA